MPPIMVASSTGPTPHVFMSTMMLIVLVDVQVSYDTASRGCMTVAIINDPLILTITITFIIWVV